jgi:beta-lactam-binding protein with PASTA domain
MFKALLKAAFTSVRFYGTVVVLLLTGAGVLYLMDTFVMPQYTKYNEGVTVPDVTKISLQDAQTQLASYGLRSEVLDRRANAAYPADYIIDQSPSPLQIVKPNRKIYLTVNTAERPKAVVPNLINMSLRNAEMQLQNGGFQLGSITYESSRFRNTILNQSEAPGDTLAKGSVIHLIVSDGLGQRKVPVPELIGLKLTEAQQQIRRAGFRVGEIRFEPTQDVTPNTVIEFSPREEELTEGQTIVLVVSERFDAIEVIEAAAVGADSTVQSGPGVPGQNQPQN